MRRTRQWLALGSLLAGVFFVELSLLAWESLFSALRARNIAVGNIVRAARLGVPFDRRTPAEVMEAERARGREVVRSIAAAEYVAGEGLVEAAGRALYPLAGISAAPTLLCNEEGAYVFVDSDEHGFANPRGRYRTGAVDVAVVGDSFAQGYCVPREASMIGRLDRRPRPVQSLAYAGQGPLAELGTLKEVGALLRPKRVLWMYFEGNDLLDLRRESRSPVLARYLEPEFRQELPRFQPEIDRALRRFVDKRLEAARARNRWLSPRAGLAHFRDALPETLTLRHLRRALGLARLKHFGLDAAETAVELERFGRVLAEAKRTVESWGGTLVFVYLPEWSNFAVPSYARSDREAVLRHARARGLNIVDLLPVFAAHPHPRTLFPLGLPGHYSAEGHAVVARALERVLTSAAAPAPSPGPRRVADAACRGVPAPERGSACRRRDR